MISQLSSPQPRFSGFVIRREAVADSGCTEKYNWVCRYDASKAAGQPGRVAVELADGSRLRLGFSKVLKEIDLRNRQSRQGGKVLVPTAREGAEIVKQFLASQVYQESASLVANRLGSNLDSLRAGASCAIRNLVQGVRAQKSPVQAGQASKGFNHIANLSYINPFKSQGRINQGTLSRSEERAINRVLAAIIGETARFD